jgi:hypothetical protein
MKTYLLWLHFFFMCDLLPLWLHLFHCQKVFLYVCVCMYIYIYIYLFIYLFLLVPVDLFVIQKISLSKYLRFLDGWSVFWYFQSCKIWHACHWSCRCFVNVFVPLQLLISNLLLVPVYVVWFGLVGWQFAVRPNFCITIVMPHW